MKQIFHSHSPQETEQIAAELGKTLRGGEVIAFHGQMGAGKTCFVRGLANGMGVSGEVCSPTFALVHEYRGPITLYHFDMYRIHDMDDLYSTGFFDYLEDDRAVLAIEWSEQIEEALPQNQIRVTIMPEDENSRTITIEGSLAP